MKKIICTLAIVFFTIGAAVAQEHKPKLILLITEQNIEGPRTAWWASQIDLSVTEAALANQLIEQGYTVIEPSAVDKVLKTNAAYRAVELGEEKTVQLANLAHADYALLGKAVASGGGNVPQSRLRSCFANVTAKLIRTKDGKVVAYLTAAGSTVHTDPVTGGREALGNAAGDLFAKISAALRKEGETK